MRVKLFIDFWNFQLNFQKRATTKTNCDWHKLPIEIKNEVDKILVAQGLPACTLHETRVYASYEVAREGKLKNWLHGWLEKQPGFTVITKERHWKEKAVHCRSCNGDIAECPTCNSKLGRSSEKMIDSRIVTDILSQAWDGSYDLAILLTSDADMVPAVENIQRRSLKVINVTWKGHGHELAKSCWASFELDSILANLYLVKK